MAYTLKSSDSAKLIFERSNAGCGSAIFIVLGSIFLLVGMGINFFSNTWEFPFMLIRLIFPLFGAGAIVFGIFIPRMASAANPKRITFDNEKGAVSIDMDILATETGYIRYDEIREFDIHIEKRSSSSSKGSRRTFYYYHVLLRKKDGGEWFITESGSEADAIAIKKQLTSHVKFDQPFNASVTPKLSPKIDRQEGAEKTIIHWQNKVSWWSPVILIVFSAVFITILSSVFFSNADDMNIFVYCIIGFIFLVFCIILFSFFKKMIKDITTRYAVAVSAHALAYYEFSKSTGVAKNTVTVPLAEINSVAYSFAPIETYANAGLIIMTQQDVVNAQQHKEKPLTALKDFISGKNNPITLSIDALNPVECLQMETWLQELIKSRGNSAVL